MLNFLKKCIGTLFTVVLGIVSAVLYGIGMVLYIVFICIAILIEKTCVFWIVIWLWMPFPGWLRVVCVIGAWLIVALIIDVLHKIM